MRVVLVAIVCCSAQATAQQWQILDGPFAAGPGVAYDSRRGRAVLFGSEGETWELEGTTRLHRPTSVAPPPRSDHAMAYDAARGNVVLFGGRNAASLGDTWLWNGSVWLQQSFPLSPSPRGDAAIAYDSLRNRIVLFGGRDLGNPDFSDTWEYDGTQWLPHLPLTVPGPPNTPRMTFDTARNVSVLLLGPAFTSNLPLLVFEWNGNDWQQRTWTSTAPAERHGFSLAYDWVRQRTVLFGGSNAGNELWEWDGTAWSRGVAAAPTTPVGPGMYFDPARAATVIVGGSDGGWRSASWSWDGTTFQSLLPDHSPPARTDCSLFHDSVRARTVLFGGRRLSPSHETWEWDGIRWTQRLPATSPPARWMAMSCFDPASATGLVFGGEGAAGVLADSWRWNGSNWSQVPGPTPPPRVDGALAWDPLRGEAILFGGFAANTWLGDTWRCNGTSWSQVTTAIAPAPRRSAAMAFDPVRGRLGPFGGAANGFTQFFHLSDTWEWNGTQWQPVSTPTSPTPLMNAGLVHDPVRGRMLLVGRNAPTTTVNGVEAWDYDGTTWTPFANSSGWLVDETRLVWDGSRQRAVLYDGKTLRELTAVPARTDKFGSGCGAPAPVLAGRSCPRTGEPQFGVELETGANLPVLFALGFGAANISIGNGCTLVVQQIVATTFMLADNRGMAVLPVPLPQNHALRGLVAHAQAGALDPQAPGGLALSAGLRINVGD